MTYFANIHALDGKRREEFLAWIREQGIDPAVVADDGRLSVHKGRVSGFEFILSETGERMYRGKKVAKKSFNVPQISPLPEGF